MARARPAVPLRRPKLGPEKSYGAAADLRSALDRIAPGFSRVGPSVSGQQDVTAFAHNTNMSNHGLTIARADLESAIARALITELNAELSALYPEPGANHFRLEPHEVAEGRGAFLVATRAGRPIGCGALRSLDRANGEIKRMFVVTEARGSGIGRAILDALEAEARALGFTRILLETGTRQLAAIALYQRAGFVPIPPYGEYVSSAATSVCMAKELEAAATGY